MEFPPDLLESVIVEFQTLLHLGPRHSRATIVGKPLLQGSHDLRVGAALVRPRPLGVGKDFSTWINDRIAGFGFNENSDFVLFPEIGEKGRGRPAKEYALTLDMAKELAMVERNDAGKRVRAYFIECERKLRGRTALPEIRTMEFHGDQIVTFEVDGCPHVAMRRIVENMHIDWARQASKLQDQGSKFACRHMSTRDTLGRERTMLCMPVDKLPLWLASINPNKIKDETTRAKVEAYQAESAIALHDYWFRGVAPKGDYDGIITGVDPSVMTAIGGMMKKIFRKQIADTLNEVVPMLVEQRMAADPRRAVADYVSVRQMLDEAKALTRKRNGLNRRFGHDLRRRALIQAACGASPARKCPHSGVWLYQRDFAATFMRERGKDLVRDHNDTISGQTVIAFPGKGEDRPNA